MSYESHLPQGGLAIFHIDYGSIGCYSLYGLSQTNEGFPLQQGWPENGNHYAVALLQADGYYDLEMGFNQGDYEDLFHASDVKELVPCKNKDNCQYPNTDSYQGGTITRTNVHITDISVSGDTMTFNYALVDFESVPMKETSSAPTFYPTSSPTVSLSDSPTTHKERKGRKLGRLCRNDRQCTSGLCKKKRRRFFGGGYKWFGRCVPKN
mgnify:CR=1 FL=1